MVNFKGMTATIKPLLAGSVLLAMSVLSQSAFADTTATVSGFAYTSPLTTTISSTSPSVTEFVYAGGFAGTTSSSAFIAYCVDIAQYLAPWGSSQTYTDGNLTSAFGSTKATDLSVLGDKYYALVSDATTSAAFQIATWEIMFEGSGAYNLGSGSFAATGGTANSAALTLAQSWLTGLSDSGVAYTGSYNIQYITSASYQDLVIFTAAVPEPETYGMVLLGLGLVGFMARRRKSA